MFPVNEAGDDTHPNKGNEPLRGFFIRAGSKNRLLDSLLEHPNLGCPLPRGPAHSPLTATHHGPQPHLLPIGTLCHYRKAPG